MEIQRLEKHIARLKRVAKNTSNGSFISHRFVVPGLDPQRTLIIEQIKLLIPTMTWRVKMKTILGLLHSSHR